jgi:hypothetical protein
MDLKEILSITGKPGLYKLIARSRTGVIVEAFADGKRFPVMASQNVSSLGDIAIYTDTEEVPLAEIFKTIFTKEEGKETLAPKASGAEIEAYFITILPNYDRERVYTSDMKKVLNWYNILHKEGVITEEAFAEKPEEEVAEATDKTAE